MKVNQLSVDQLSVDQLSVDQLRWYHHVSRARFVCKKQVSVREYAEERGFESPPGIFHRDAGVFMA
jgi:hypothetical protein